MYHWVLLFGKYLFNTITLYSVHILLTNNLCSCNNFVTLFSPQNFYNIMTFVTDNIEIESTFVDGEELINPDPNDEAAEESSEEVEEEADEASEEADEASEEAEEEAEEASEEAEEN